MKTFFVLLLTILMPFPVYAGIFFGTNNRTVIYNYGAAPAAVYSAPPVDYYPAPGPTVYYSAPAAYTDDTIYTAPTITTYSTGVYYSRSAAGIVRQRQTTKTRGGRTIIRTHTKEIQ